LFVDVISAFEHGGGLHLVADLLLLHKESRMLEKSFLLSVVFICSEPYLETFFGVPKRPVELPLVLIGWLHNKQWSIWVCRLWWRLLFLILFVLDWGFTWLNSVALKISLEYRISHDFRLPQERVSKDLIQK